MKKWENKSESSKEHWIQSIAWMHCTCVVKLGQLARASSWHASGQWYDPQAKPLKIWNLNISKWMKKKKEDKSSISECSWMFKKEDKKKREKIYMFPRLLFQKWQMTNWSDTEKARKRISVCLKIASEKASCENWRLPIFCVL